MGEEPFSALQRAENSSIYELDESIRVSKSFSALQRAENSSIWRRGRCGHWITLLSVLFSEPKIPQCVL